MNKKVREFVFVTSVSFTLVSFMNALLGIFDLTTIVGPVDVLLVLVTCMIISSLITIGDYIPFIKDHIIIYNYLVVIIVAQFSNTLLLEHFYWQNFFIQIVLLTIVFFGVGFLAYGYHCKTAMLINKKLDESQKRNLK